MAATGSYHHVSVFLQNDIGAVIEVEDGNGVELCWGTARFRHGIGVYKVNLEANKL